MVEIENLVKRYGDFVALDHLNLPKEKYLVCLDQTDVERQPQ